MSESGTFAATRGTPRRQQAMLSAMPSFGLVDEPWIPVIKGGLRLDVSLREALLEASEIDALALDNPLEAVALLRQVLLPVALDATGVPRSQGEWASRWRDGSLNEAAATRYLEQHRARFDLFDAQAPFAQVAGLRTARDETKPSSLLLPAVASGNNVPLFSARTEADPPTLSPPEAARALLAVHCWDTAAIKSGAVGDPLAKNGKTTGNPTGPVGQLGVLIPLGRTLAETIHLNTPVLPQGLHVDDSPQWREEPLTAEWRERPARGLLDLLTWQSRRVRLVPEPGEHGEWLVRRVVLAAGDRLSQVKLDEELHSATRRVEKPQAGRPPRQPLRHRADRAPWQGLAALLATDDDSSDSVSTSPLLSQIAGLQVEAQALPDDYPLQVLVAGVIYGNQSAVVEHVISDLIPLPTLALTADSQVHGLLLEVVEEADLLRQAANRLGDDLRRAAGADRLPFGKGDHLGETLMHDFTPVVRRLLAGLQRQPGLAEAAGQAWRRTARQLALAAAEPVLDAVPPTAFLGRRDEHRAARHRLNTAEARYRAAINSIVGPAPNDPGVAAR